MAENLPTKEKANTLTSASSTTACASTAFVSEIRTIIDTARSNAVRSVDFCRVQMLLEYY